MENKALDTFKDKSIDEIALLAKTDEAAIEYLIGKYEYYIKYFTKNYFLHGAEYTDLLQESRIAILKAIKNYNGKNSFEPFVKLCIKRYIISLIRKYNSKGNFILNNSLSLDKTKDNNDDYDNSYMKKDLKAEDPLNLLISKEKVIDIQKCVENNFSKLEKDVYNLYIESHSYQYISNKLNISQKSVDCAIIRAKKKIKKEIESMIDI